MNPSVSVTRQRIDDRLRHVVPALVTLHRITARTPHRVGIGQLERGGRTAETGVEAEVGRKRGNHRTADTAHIVVAGRSIRILVGSAPPPSPDGLAAPGPVVLPYEFIGLHGVQELRVFVGDGRTVGHDGLVLDKRILVHLNHVPCGIGGLLPLLGILLLREEVIAVHVLHLALVDIGAVVERRGGVEQHARTQRQRGALRGAARPRRGVDGGNLRKIRRKDLGDVPQLRLDELDILIDGVAVDRLRVDLLVGRLVEPEEDRAVLTEEAEVVVGAQEAGLGLHHLDLFRVVLLVLVDIVQEDRTLVDRDIEPIPETEIS